MELIMVFFLVFVRVSTFFLAGPLLGLRTIPALYKVGISFIMALAVLPLVNTGGGEFLQGWNFFLSLTAEAGMGLSLGFMSGLLLNGIRVAGQLVDAQIGYAMASMMDPVSGSQNTLLAEFLYLLGMVFFFNINGHHLLVLSLVNSYQILPLAGAHMSGDALNVMVRSFAAMFLLALQISAPVLAVMVICDVGLGFLARTVPQVNVFMLGFHLKIIVGLLILSAIIPLLGASMAGLTGMMERDLLLLLKALVK